MRASVSKHAELKPYIRFQLAQLSARNAEHEFEHLAFDLARARVATNLVPATGPVQSGGDQGRDFESYRSFLADSPLSRSSFAGRVSDGIVAGACTLDKKIVRKVKADLKTIFASGERPTHVVYFCETNLPVAKRHALQKHCRDEYAATLDIFDGQAIADMLADPDVSWISEKYLAVPLDMWPAPSLGEDYISVRDKWLIQKLVPENYADFLEIKRGLRTATFEEDAKRDLGGWIDSMRNFLAEGSPERLLQKARYEICVAELRGRGSLDPAMPLLEAFLETASSDHPAPELLDAAVLTLYAWGSKAHGQSSISAGELNAWLARSDSVLEDALAIAGSRGDRCLLLEAQALTAALPRKTDTHPLDGVDRFLARWEAALEVVRETPLFPINHIADIFETATTIVEPSDRFRALTNKVDELVAQRAGKGAAAERARNRAIKYLEAERVVAAINELHHAKAEWFTGEGVVGSVLAMLLLSECYEDLGLHIAARSYAAAALFTVLNVDLDRTSRFIAGAAFRASETYLASGEGITYLHSLSPALAAHYHVAADPHDWDKHPSLQRTIAHAVALRAIALRTAPELIPLIDEAIGNWPLPETDLNDLRGMSQEEPWANMTTEEIERSITRELAQHPFGDVGRERSVIWTAFGITWQVKSTADADTWMAALELTAAIQIAQVEFSDVDLLIIPSRAVITVELGDRPTPSCSQIPDNGMLAWNVTMPKVPPEKDSKEYQPYLVAVVLMVLGQATALPFADLERIIENRMGRGLPSRIFFVRPLQELLRFVQPESVDLVKLAAFAKPAFHFDIQPKEADELRWRDGPGPGYSRSLAEQHLRNRYATTSRGLNLTLPHIVGDDRCRRLLTSLQDEGFLDWQILNALLILVGQQQVEAKLGRGISPSAGDSKLVRDRILREERNEDGGFDLSTLTEDRIRMHLKLGVPAIFKTWGLVSHRRTPDFAAMKRLLDVRYRNSTDDIAHDNPFLPRRLA